MAMDINVVGGVSNAKQEVTTAGFSKVITETNIAANPANVGGTRLFSEIDSGYITSFPVLYSPEVDVDYRTRVSTDTMLDEEVFNYVLQNTGKHQGITTTMIPAWSAGQFIPNSTSILTTTTGTYLQTYASFANIGTNTLSGDVTVSFSAQPSTNNFAEFGFAPNITSAVASPIDGIFFRLTSAGLQGIISINGSETSTGIFTGAANVGTWTYTNNKRYQFILYASAVEAKFWVNDGTGAVLLGTINLPIGNGRISLGAGVRWFMGQRITGGAAASALQVAFNAYSIRLGGQLANGTLAQTGNRIYGSYQGLAGGTQGSLANYANSANPVAAVPTNTTAALGTGLGGQFWETCTLALNSDGIISSYQVPTPAVNGQNRRLVISGVSISSFIAAALVGNAGTAGQWSLAFGGTAVSLTQGEAAGTKAPRRIALPFTHVLTAAQAIGTDVAQAVRTIQFTNPIYVNAGEVIQTVRKTVGTTQASAGTIAHLITFDYGWE
jgi:hypothetical protein